MRTLLFLLEKEFKQIARDRFLPKIMLIIPILQLTILPFAANFEMKNINIGVIDRDHSTTSMRLIEKIKSSGYFKLTHFTSNYKDALTKIEDKDADILLDIPPSFEKDLETGNQVKLYIAADAVNGTKGGLGSSYLSTIIQDFNQELIGKGRTNITPPISYSYLYNPHLSYKRYMVPGIIVFLLTLIGGFISALNIVSEKEKGTIEQINVTPIPKTYFLLGKLIPFWLFGFVLLTIGMFIAWILYGLIPVGSFGVIYLFSAVYLFAFTGFGLTISNYSSTQQQSMFTAFFFLIIFALMSGLFTPIDSMPHWAQIMTRFNPFRYFVEVMRMIYLKGSALVDLAPQFLIIIIFAVLFNFMAIISYRKRN